MSHEHEGIPDYAEMAGLGHTEYDQVAAHAGDHIEIHGEPGTQGSVTDIRTHHADGSFSEEVIDIGQDGPDGMTFPDIPYQERTFHPDHTVSGHAIHTDYTSEAHVSGGLVDHSTSRYFEDPAEGHGLSPHAGDEIHHAPHPSADPAVDLYTDPELEGL
jgi:hypothetical protein